MRAVRPSHRFVFLSVDVHGLVFTAELLAAERASHAQSGGTKLRVSRAITAWKGRSLRHIEWRRIES
jgi:hypothetical protein